MNSASQTPIQVAEGIFWIGAHRRNAYLQCNTYALVRDESVLIIDPGPAVLFPTVYSNLAGIADPASIVAIVATQASPDAISSLGHWAEAGLTAKLYAHWWTALSIGLNGYAGAVQHVHSRNAANLRPLAGVEIVTLDDLSDRGMVCVYDQASGVLFSGDLFGHPDGGSSSFAARLTAYNRRLLRSAATRQTIRAFISDRGVRTICPQHGGVIDLREFDLEGWFARLEVDEETLAENPTALMEEELESLRQQNADLTESVVLANDARIKDSATGFYNETLLQKMLPTVTADGHRATVVVVAIDEPASGAWNASPNLQEQTMRGLATEIMSTPLPSAFTFRFRGFSCAIVIQDQGVDDVRAVVQGLVNRIRESELFPLAVTVSVALAGIEQLQQVQPNQYDPVDSILGAMIAVLDRLEEEGAETYLELGSTISPDEIGRSGGAVLVSPDPFLGESLMAFLETRDIYCRQIDNGADAATWLSTGVDDSGRRLRPEIIISELSISQLDGFQLRQLLLDDPLYRDTPFVLVTDYKSAAVAQRAIALGIEHTFVKPLDLSEVAGVCELVVRRRRR